MYIKCPSRREYFRRCFTQAYSGPAGPAANTVCSTCGGRNQNGGESEISNEEKERKLYDDCRKRKGVYAG